MKHRVVVVAIVVGCLLGGIAVFSGGVAASDIAVENTLSQSDSTGQIDVETRVSVPDSTASLELRLPEGVDVHRTRGFRQIDDRTYEWTESTSEPYLQYEYEGTVRGTHNDREGVYFVAADEWALVRTPGIGVSGSAATGTEITRTNTVSGEGVASTHMAYLGAYTEHTGSAAGQEVSLIVPETANLQENPEDIVDTLEAAAERLAIGDQTEGVFVIAAPTAEHTWAPAGLQRGDGGDMWVQDAERLGTERDTWIHEYVHTRQQYATIEDGSDGTTAATRWTIEGMAEYYAALLPYETGGITYQEFRDRIEEGAADEYNDVRLAEPATWEGTTANYDRGALVFAHLDRRLRAAADTTLEAVIAGINGRDTQLTQRRFLDAIEAAGGADIRADAQRYTETTETPPIATQREHVSAFGGPDIRYSIEEATVTGPYRNETFGNETTPLVVGESVELTVAVENFGTEGGSFDGELRVNDESVATDPGELDAGASTTRRFTHEFGSPDGYEVSIGTERLTVPVEEPAEIEVTGIDVDPAETEPGESVTLRATVESAAERPAAGEVVFDVDGEAVATESVRIGAGTQTVETAVEFDEAGEYTVSAGGRSTTVTVVNSTEADEPVPEPPTPEDQPGFGPAVAVVALFLAVVVAKRR